MALYGVTFPQGEPVAVDHPVLLSKLPNNCDFREHFDAPSAAEDFPFEPAGAEYVEVSAEQNLKAALAESMRLDPPLSDLVHRGPVPQAEPIPSAPLDAAPVAPLVLPVVMEPPKRKPGRPRKEA